MMIDPAEQRVLWEERMAGVYDDEDDYEPTGTAWDEPDTPDWHER